MARKQKAAAPAAGGFASKAWDALQKKYGKRVDSLESSNIADVKYVIPTGDAALDIYGLGIGGVPSGRIIEIYGPESAGKSSLLASLIANVQKMDGEAFLCDAEHALDASRCRTFGVDTKRVLQLDPAHLQQGLQMIRDGIAALPNNGLPTLWAVDSVPALLPKEELEGEMGDVVMGVRARMWSTFCGSITADLARTNATLILVNQIRMKIGVVFGNPETTPGGNAIKFYSSVRLRLGAGQVKDDRMLLGNLKVVKNKLSIPGRKMKTRLNFAKGYDSDWSVLNIAKDLDLNIEAKSRDADLARRLLTEFVESQKLGAPARQPKSEKAANAAAALSGEDEDGVSMPFSTDGEVDAEFSEEK